MADIEAEREMSRSDVAEYMRTFANELDASGGAGTDGAGSNDRTNDSSQRDDSRQRDDTAPSDDTGTGTGNSDDAGHSDSTNDSNTAETSGNDADENTTDDYATDAERRNRDDSSGSDASSGRVTFMVGNESTTINPPEHVTFEVSVDSDSALIGSGTGRTARFALHWDESDVDDDEGLSIQ